ncbi:DNA-directed RNA polymerase subunit D [Candidatus Micrarchaeota archaeon]|nr:MAG: DNA-directed RNA polymerase subunit D [Candidatus Micrarchaeota archaeon]
MKVEKIKKSNEGLNLSFTLKKAGTAFANSLRRISMGQVPVLAIDGITMYENSSAFFDEYIANRTGLIPIKTPDGYEESDEVLFELSAEGPGVVYSKDLTCSERGVACVAKKIPIIELVEDQVLRFEGRARLGRGREHAKFQPCLASYGYDDKAKEFNFMVESFGQMSAAAVMLKTAEILQDKCEQMLEQLGKKK